jgi:uncharacterized membrane protein YdjX (TVP38/TMEM64 family)
MAAGVLFKPFSAALAVVILCVMVSGSIGFLGCRYGFREYLLGLPICRTRTFRLMYSEMSVKPAMCWRIALLIRFSQVLPFAIGNYLLAVTPISFGHYVLTTTFGVLPGLLIFIYAGSILNDFTDIDNGEPVMDRKKYWMSALTLGSVGVVAIVTMVCLARRAWRRILRRSLYEEDVNVDGEKVVELDVDSDDYISDDDSTCPNTPSTQVNDQIPPSPDTIIVKFHRSRERPDIDIDDERDCDFAELDESLPLLPDTYQHDKEPFLFGEKVLLAMVSVGALLSLSIGLPLLYCFY